ncbi:TolC family protein [Steroidobacter cummioxidans]|uniref:TolC family protein n=1 Tax=Steroidobacter cummioxidans TaxID=1803913 RepID=UPI000E30FD7E|nr:TolC family protein [Steroidobacter cummioxidans]
MNFSPRYFYLICAASLSGCMSLGPDGPPRPSVSAEGEFIGAAAASVTSEATAPDWWNLFDDPALDSHVRRALSANTDLRVAVANLDIARSSQRLAQAAQLPATVIESGAGPERADRQPSTSSVLKTSYELGATVAYEIDLFGRLRAASRAARAETEASTAARDTVRVAVIADTVSAYIDYCTATATREIAAGLVNIQQRSVGLVTHQLGEGEVSQLEQAQSLAALESARAAVPPLEADQSRALFRLATLEGMTPAAAEPLRPACESPPLIARALPVGDGASLISRRPDIREAEHRLAAATDRIGVATADLYPRIMLGGSAGRISGGFDSFLTPLITWSFPNQSVARAKRNSRRPKERRPLLLRRGTQPCSARSVRLRQLSSITDWSETAHNL